MRRIPTLVKNNSSSPIAAPSYVRAAAPGANLPARIRRNPPGSVCRALPCPRPYNRKGTRAPRPMTEPTQQQSKVVDPNRNGGAPKTVSTALATKEPAQTDARKQDEDPVGKVYDSVLIRRLARYVKPYWWQALI